MYLGRSAGFTMPIMSPMAVKTIAMVPSDPRRITQPYMGLDSLIV
jgi:hypothetical protein